MSRKLQAACEGELDMLGRRMGFLLERPELAADANPVSPATVCSALRDCVRPDRVRPQGAGWRC
jgi:hypothetical protein